MSRKAAWVDEKSGRIMDGKIIFWGGIRLRASRLRRDTGFIVPHDPFSAAQRRFSVAYSLIGEGASQEELSFRF